MSGYICLFKTRLINGLQYRSAAFAGILTQVFWGFLNIMVFISFYSHISPDNVKISLPQLVSYVWLNQAFLKLIFIYMKDSEIMDTIKNGTVAYELCRPYNLYNWWFIKITSDKYSSVLLRFVPIIIMGVLLPHPYTLELPYSFTSFILFFISLILGSLLLISFQLIILTIGFFTNEDKGIGSFIFVIADLFSGGIVPLPLMPNLIQKIGLFLPFRFISDMPFRIYSGNIPSNDAMYNILFQLIWIIILFIIGQFIMKIILKKVSIQGG